MAHELTVQRKFKTPRANLYNAFSRAAAVAQWWGPGNNQLAIARFDFRVEGICLYNYVDDAGSKWWCRFVFQEIDPPKRIMFLSSFCDENAKILRAPFHAHWPLEVTNNWNFIEETPGQTLLSILVKPYSATPKEKEAFTGALPKMGQDYDLLLDRLAIYTGSMP